MRETSYIKRLKPLGLVSAEAPYMGTLDQKSREFQKFSTNNSPCRSVQEHRVPKDTSFSENRIAEHGVEQLFLAHVVSSATIACVWKVVMAPFPCNWSLVEPLVAGAFGVGRGERRVDVGAADLYNF